MEELNYDEIDDMIFAGDYPRDYPDYANLFVERAWYQGREMTDDELDLLNEDRNYVYEQFMKQKHNW